MGKNASPPGAGLNSSQRTPEAKKVRKANSGGNRLPQICIVDFPPDTIRDDYCQLSRINFVALCHNEKRWRKQTDKQADTQANRQSVLTRLRSFCPFHKNEKYRKPPVSSACSLRPCSHLNFVGRREVVK